VRVSEVPAASAVAARTSTERRKTMFRRKKKPGRKKKPFQVVVAIPLSYTTSQVCSHVQVTHRYR